MEMCVAAHHSVLHLLPMYVAANIARHRNVNHQHIGRWYTSLSAVHLQLCGFSLLSIL